MEMSVKGTSGEEVLRRSDRTNKGKHPDRYGWENDDQRSWLEKKTDGSISEVKSLSLQSKFRRGREAASESHHLNKSKSSHASSITRRKLEMELKMEKSLVDAEAKFEAKRTQRKIDEFKRQLEDELEENELKRIKRVSEKKLALELSKIEEDFDASDGHSQQLSDEGYQHRSPNVQVRLDRNRSEVPSPVFDNWMDTNAGYRNPSPTPNNIPNQPVPHIERTVSELAQVFAQALSIVNTNKTPQSTEDRIDKFLVRQTMGKDLPIFAGEPEEWPGFIEDFNRSTVMCKFSAGENLQRLRKCLKGKAKDAVQAMLVVPENVDQVIKTLAINFGKPRLIISTLIEKAKKTPSPKDEQLESIIPFSNAVSNLVTTMETLNRPDYMNNPQLMDELVEKLPDNFCLDWAKVKRSREKESESVNLRTFADWIVEQAEAITEVRSFNVINQKPKLEPFKSTGFDKRKKSSREAVFAAANDDLLDNKTSKVDENKTSKLLYQPKTALTEKDCIFCKRNHILADCASFQDESLDKRWEIVKSLGLCFSCLKSGHSQRFCKEKKACKKGGCERRHHKLLHGDAQVIDKETVVTGASVGVKSNNDVLIRVIPVTVKGPKGEIATYAFLDDGSTCSMIEADVANKIGINGPITPLNVKGVFGVLSKDNEAERVNFQLRGTTKATFAVAGVKKVRNIGIPCQSVNISELAQKWKYLKKVGIQSLKNARPTVLIGEDHIDLIIAREVVEGPKNGPVLSRTKLGWVIHGNVAKFKGRVDKDFIFCAFDENRDELLHQTVKESFKTESFGVRAIKKPLRSKDEERAQMLMEKYTNQLDGRYETGLLWKKDNVHMPMSKNNALKRLHTAEKKMDRDPAFSKWYLEKIDEYLGKGYGKFLSEEEAAVVTPKTWYLPHFGVVNPNKPGKVRFVLDAAAKSCGTSLNDNLLQGPDILNSLVGTLCKFRQKRFGFGGDMKDFFHQVKIRVEDQDAQRFLWRGMERDREPDTLVMKVLFFGATCSPYVANFVKNKNAVKFGEDFPEAAEAILHRHYVDDYLDSADFEEEGANLIKSVIEVHRRGGFELGKICSSSKLILAQVPPELRSSDVVDISLENEMPFERALGLMWDPNSDSFSFNMTFPKVAPEVVSGRMRATKRQVLKLVMSVFDPLGFLAHYVIKAKILLQDIWRVGIGWDDELTQELQAKFQRWLEELTEVAKIRIGRCYSMKTRFAERISQLHIFCDAGEKAFSAVAFIRMESGSIVETSLIMAKTRVAPLRPLSIPRLELQAAVMSTRLMETIKAEHEIVFEEIHFWTDSRTVLQWIRSDARNFKTFVSHRVGEILEATDVESWHWVPTEENVADDATRDCKSCDFSEENRWWTCPPFLKLAKDHWPAEPEVMKQDREVEGMEYKREIVHFTQDSLCDSRLNSLPEIQRFSSWLRLIRTTARVWLCARHWKCKTLGFAIPPKDLIPEDLISAERLWWRLVQCETFPREIQMLESGDLVSKKSNLYQLSPFLDKFGVVRMKGRIGVAPGINEFTKCPVLFDSKHPFVRLLIDFHHVQAGHNGVERVFNEMRQKYWIINMRAAVRSSWSRCQVCKNNRAEPQVPEMGSLPLSRLSSRVRPFTYTGVDYFGPMDVTIGRRHEKRYGVLFTCSSTRAVHLEIAASLTTDSCIMAVRRLIGRRGSPLEINSDNGTNRRGGDRELKAALLEFNNTKIKEILVTKGINWHFIPPSAPHMGGSWERLVKSVKVALTSVLKEKAPKEEVLQTLFVEAEHIVNSRPLTHVSVDPNDLEALTPNHFLIGTSSGAQQPGFFTEADLCLRRQWRIAQKMADNFWSRWMKEYVPTLTKRSKWHDRVESIKMNDVVIIADGDMPRNCWPRGVVVAKYPGKDGVIRVVDVKTATGTYRRPVAKVIVLDVRKLDEGNPSPVGSMSSSMQPSGNRGRENRHEEGRREERRKKRSSDILGVTE